MKKNKMMRLASMLLVVTLLSTSVISGTFAKYVTTDSANDTARVAKWGVVATVSGDLFGATYQKVGDGNSIITYSANGGTVSSDGAANFVVAPGTKNETGMTVSVAGTPEVATKVTVKEAEDSTGKDFVNSDIYLKPGKYGVMVPYTGTKTNDNQVNYFTYDATTQKYTKMTAGQAVSDWYELRVTNGQAFASMHDTNDYYPINWTVQGATGTIDKVVDVDNAVKAALTYVAGANEPNDNLDKSTTITWSWAFGTEWSDGSNGDPENTTAIDEQDTVLGNMMVGADAKVVVVSGDTCTQVNYATVDAGTKEAPQTNANTIEVAYTGTTYNKNNIVACLTVAYSQRVIVEQVD